MIRRRLYLQIYAVLLLVATLTIAAAGALGRFFAGPEAPPELIPVAEHLVAGLPPGDEAGGLERLGEQSGLSLALTAPDGSLVAGYGRPLPPPLPDGPPSQMAPTRDGPVLLVRLHDARWLAVSWPWHPAAAAHLVLALTLLLALTAAAAWPMSRRITLRVERLRAGVEAFGSGALDVRVPVQGQDEVAALAAAFNTSADRISALVAGQRRMLASASHELRSPLARLRMALELVEGDPAVLASATRDVEELDALVGDLLLTARAQAGGRADEPVDVGALAADEAARVGASATGAGTVRGDPKLLRRLVRNLLENARKYGGPQIRVTVRGAELVVEDDGAGVPEAERERIWEPFYRPPGHREGQDGGVGLGLAMVREIARMHGGTAVFEPRAGGGSRFVVRLAADG